MKKHILSTAILGIITLFSYTFVNAQINSPIVANIPFDFFVGDKKMAAGGYIIKKLSPMSSQTALSLRRADGKDQTKMMTVPTKITRKSDGTLLFNRYGDIYYLSQIHNSIAEYGVKLRQNKAEINLACQFGKPKRDTASLNSLKKQNAETNAASPN